ncbi:MAG: hypothetical protein OXC96_04160 [Cyanobacteria bacterium MAG CAR1_bin_15]|nr:hypothetical protein [Cyanobacteria bacterium MAG CAR1_bin_15]
MTPTAALLPLLVFAPWRGRQWLPDVRISTAQVVWAPAWPSAVGL